MKLISHKIVRDETSTPMLEVTIHLTLELYKEIQDHYFDEQHEIIERALGTELFEIIKKVSSDASNRQYGLK